MGYLDQIKTSKNIKELDYKQTAELAEEIRQKIVSTVSKTGGHLASNLGVVELTLALHRVFDLPNDSIIFDVGHQCYVHKLLTGRKEEFDTIRSRNGISGFTKSSESEYDVFGAGHSGTSVSAALGIACAERLNKKDTYTIAVVGDGSLTNGMIYEALNNCTSDNSGMIVILNDNEMSISKNVGTMSSYLAEFSNSRSYIKFKNRIYAISLKTKGVGRFFLSVGRTLKNSFKKIFMTKNYFECLGLKYFGPIDGHDQELLELVLEQAKKINRPSIIHVITKKGKGYAPAEKHPELFHSVGSFDKESGETKKAKYDFSAAFGEVLTELADQDSDITAVTAAMGYGTGLNCFTDKYPDRFFDVGIAEEHALTFCAGLATKGKKAVFAVYSSFLQRCYDQIIHDVAIQKLPVVIAIDRAGLVPGDGVTHQGIYDSAFMLGIPEFEVYSPENYEDLKSALKLAVLSEKPVAVRYPKGCEKVYEQPQYNECEGYSYADIGNGAKNAVLISYGRVVFECVKAAELLSNKYTVRLIKLKKIKPLPLDEICELVKDRGEILVVEEGIKRGGVGELIASSMKCNAAVRIHALDGNMNYTGSVEEMFEEFGFTPQKIALMLSENE